MVFNMDVNDFRERLFLDVYTLESKKAALDSFGIPYQSRGKYALAPRLFVGEKNDAGNYELSAFVTHEMLLDVGMDMDTLFEECRQNSRKLYPGEIAGISEYLEKMDMEMEPDGIAMPQVYVLTNSCGMNGAAAFFYQPDLIDNLATMLGKDLLVFPSGKNEMFCIPISNSMQLGELQEMYYQAISLLDLDAEHPLAAEVMQYDHIKHNVRQMDGSTFALGEKENIAQITAQMQHRVR